MPKQDEKTTSSERKIADPPIISLDIETYGASRPTHDWRRLPPQEYFHPRKSEYWQGVHRGDLILTCAITVMKSDPRDGKWNRQAIEQLEPGDTFVLDMSRSMDQKVLSNWLRHADTIIGSNLQFDLIYLRRFLNDYKFLLDGRHTYIDTTIVAYLWNELSSSRSLKKLGPLLGQFSYDESLQGGNRFNHATDERLIKYNGQDTHNTVLVLSELARRLPKNTCKLSEFSINHYSQAINAVVNMSEAGIPFSSIKLQTIKTSLEGQINTAMQQCSDYGLILSGKGSAQSKTEFFDDVVTSIESAGGDVIDLLEKTPKTKKISHSKKNRLILEQHLEDTESNEQQLEALKNFGKFQEAQKLLSTYVFPLLLHKRNNPTNFKSSLIPWHDKLERPFRFEATDIIQDSLENNNTITPKQLEERFSPRADELMADCAVYPSWFITPSRVKEDEGSQGGTVQGRITCKDPSAQTFPPQIKNCITTRFDARHEGVIVGIDLSQIELRVAAMLSGEDSMINSYMNDLDLHADRARSLWPNYDTEPDQKKQRRQVGKMMNFADLFLASANTMREQVYAQSGGDINLPIDIYQRVVQTREQVRPSLSSWQKKLLHIAKTKGRIELPLIGQSRSFTDIASERSEIVNFPVQTTASNLMMQIQAHFLSNLQDLSHTQAPRLFLQIFDAVYVDTPGNLVDAVGECFDRAVQTVVSPSGYWGRLAEWLGREPLPIKFDVETID